MSTIKKQFMQQLGALQDKKDVIESLTQICATNDKYAEILVEALFEEFNQVFAQ